MVGRDTGHMAMCHRQNCDQGQDWGHGQGAGHMITCTIIWGGLGMQSWLGPRARMGCRPFGHALPLGSWLGQAGYIDIIYSTYTISWEIYYCYFITATINIASDTTISLP